MFWFFRGHNQRRLTPSFPVEMWNVHERTEQDMPRTNNSVEGFHHAFNKSVTSHHPTLWRLIKSFMKEEVLAQTKKTQFDRGDQILGKKKYRDVNGRLKNIVERYNSNSKVAFLRSISHNLHLF